MDINPEKFTQEHEPLRRGVQVVHQGIRNVMTEVNVASGTVAVVAGYSIASSAKLQEVADAISQLSRLVRTNQADKVR